jgi:hypothetical protein
MNATRAIAAATAALYLAACTTVPAQPQADYSLVDPGRTDMVQYAKDYEDCAHLANQADVASSAAATAAAGAALGAILGALIGGVICGSSCAREGAAFGAGYGGTSGAVSGAGAAARDQQVTVRGCLSGRGYFVIR